MRSKYEPRQIWRLLVDIFKLRWKQPIRRADAIYQRSYLRKLPKYKVLAIRTPIAGQPVATGSQPAERYYLEGPKLPPDAGKDELLLVAEGAGNPGVFRFDEKNGWLFCDGVDDYDYMYYAHVGSLTVPPVNDKRSLYWKRSRMVMEKEPYRFKGVFQTWLQDTEKFLSWKFCNEGGLARWDTKNIIYARDFAVEADNKLFVRGPGSTIGILYNLKLITDVRM